MTKQGTAPDVTPERLRELVTILERENRFSDALDALRQCKTASFDGAWGSTCALLAATLSHGLSGPLMVVSAHPSTAEVLEGDFRLFTQAEAVRFPALESLSDQGLIREESVGTRLRLLKRLAVDSSALDERVIFTSIPALLQPVPDRSEMEKNTRGFRVGQRLNLNDLRSWFIEHHFHATTAVDLPGEFSVRGGICDIFAPDWEQPIRIELFDDTIDSIRRFEISSQRSTEMLTSIEVTASRSCSDGREHLAAYLPPNSVILLLEPEQLEVAAQRYLERVEYLERYHSLPDVWRSMSRFGRASAGSVMSVPAERHCTLGLESVSRFEGDFSRVREELQRTSQDGDVLIVAATEAEIKRLREVFGTLPLAMAGRLSFVLGQLECGFRVQSQSLVVLTSAEIFHRTEVRRATKKHLGKAIDSFLDLQPGDLVVHLSHGIGRYRGMRLIEKQDFALEHLELEFEGGTKIFVPAAKIGLVQKYVGGTKSRPRLAKIGNQTWGRQKKAAEAAVMDMAGDLLDLQAQRMSRIGISFAADSEWQIEFDASFPYQETNDQLAAIAAIKGDMEGTRPMDRLLCGDVGFGKTEVAMRAAFKAVDNGFQVAVLVPTTILAEQHYLTFRERLAEFPFDIARLSRFCSTQQERETIQGLASGRIDIVIGTHRLASHDVAFLNLGLVVIDEEQRFGVEVKERLKTLRSTVDVLTMTATPIPRTLHMSMVGLRDIANLETPPEDRVAVETKIMRFDELAIRNAILHELSRDGQVYFVHNRVNDIELLARKLRDLVPEADIRVGHGQMHEDELESVMVDFVAHRFDVLVATTIVESGLDIPNANTIFIDEADRYGLADLHQLRGRVGRYKHRAYCYLLLERGKVLTPLAAKRLRAIEEFSEMGAGFALSMRDLEIRGAGNLLGAQQSGHISAVGYELYCELLENAVRSLRKLPPRLSLDVEINLPGRAFLPDDYVPDIRAKIDVYRRIARIANDDELRAIRDELRDRFGPLPDPVDRMLRIAELRMDAAIWQISAISTEQDYMVFEYAERGRMEHLARLNVGKLRIVDAQSAYLTIPAVAKTPQGLLNLAKSVLRAAATRR